MVPVVNHGRRADNPEPYDVTYFWYLQFYFASPSESMFDIYCTEYSIQNVHSKFTS